MIDDKYRLKVSKAEAAKLRTRRGELLREVKALKEKLKRAKRALTYYGCHAIVDIDCGYTARVALNELKEDEDNGE